MKYRYLFLFYLFIVVLAFAGNRVSAQNPITIDRLGSAANQGRNLTGSRGDSSFRRRDDLADSITIYYRFFDSSRTRFLDSTINNFFSRYPVPLTYTDLGNAGTAARSLIFNPQLNPGWNHGFHAFDPYRFTISNTPFYQTTRPYTELGYLLGTTSEQMVNILHTQNVRPDFNIAFQYRFLNSPGSYKNQNTSHNNVRISAHYQSRNKRYNAYAIYYTNKLLSSENGGIKYDSLLSDPRFSDRFVIDTRLGGDSRTGRNFFNTNVLTGNLYNETTLLYRQQYDLGQKDSLVVNDSTTYRLFYPRLRFQHTLSYSKHKFQFRDFSNYSNKDNDYRQYFGYQPLTDSISFVDQWSNVVNDFSLISFPEKNNLNQFLKLGATLQNLNGSFASYTKNYYNVVLNGEYRNRTRNQKWNIEALGQFYALGEWAGNYSAQLHLQRLLSQRLGSLEVGFRNVNRAPSFVFNNESSFPVVAGSLNNENITRLHGSLQNAFYNFSVGGEYYLVSNYAYFDGYFSARQEGTIFNLLHLYGNKRFKLSRRWSLLSELHLQQTTPGAPVNVPLLLSINRLTYEGNFYRNLFLATGLEVRYHTPYKADGYSPFIGQFFLQNDFTLHNRPDIHAFLNFRVKTFKAFIRAENINSLRLSTGNVGFTQENMALEHYPMRSFWFRLGIWWTFIN